MTDPSGSGAPDAISIDRLKELIEEAQVKAAGAGKHCQFTSPAISSLQFGGSVDRPMEGTHDLSFVIGLLLTQASDKRKPNSLQMLLAVERLFRATLAMRSLQLERMQEKLREQSLEREALPFIEQETRKYQLLESLLGALTRLVKQDMESIVHATVGQVYLSNPAMLDQPERLAETLGLQSPISPFMAESLQLDHKEVNDFVFGDET